MEFFQNIASKLVLSTWNDLHHQMGTPGFFLENAHLKSVMGGAWHKNDARVIAHDNMVHTHAQIKKSSWDYHGVMQTMTKSSNYL